MTIAVAAADFASLGHDDARSARAVRIWLWTLVLLVVAMVAVGGATRLTGSGLSITEWKPVTGAIPPLSAEAWAAEFAKYRQIDQYQLLNRGMSLAEFQTIYWWEWGHRQLGRFLGLAFLLPLAWFWWRGAIRSRLALALLGIGALGGLQATVGWIMVASGLEPGMTAVAPIKLTLHLTLASVILASLVWIATGLGRAHASGAAIPSPRVRGEGRSPLAGAEASPKGEGEGGSTGPLDSERPPHPRSADAALASHPGKGVLSPLPAGGERWGALALLALVFLQITLGGLVAGSKAGLTFNTWPLMDGRLIPQAATLFAVTPWIENFVDNVALVQLNHRLVAYALLAFALWHAFDARRRAPGTGAARRATALAGLTLAQGALGVVTLLLAVPLWAGLAHQILAMAVLIMAVVHARTTRLEA